SEREQELVLALCARRVDGLVVIPAGDDHRCLEPEIRAGVATVFVDRPAGRIDADVVVSDNFGGARDGVAHLIAHGHRRIGFIGDMPRIHTAAERLRGYRAAMEDAGIPVAPAWMSLGVTDPQRVRRAAEEMLRGPDPVTAVCAGNNRVTVTVIRVLAEQARRVALVGFDDIELGDLLRPGVTVVAQDAAALGRTAAERLFRRLGGTLPLAERIELPTRLIARRAGERGTPDRAADDGRAADARGAGAGRSAARGPVAVSGGLAGRLGPARRGPAAAPGPSGAPGPGARARRRFQRLPRPAAAQDGGVGHHRDRPDGAGPGHG